MKNSPRTVYATLGLLEEYMELDKIIDILMQARRRAINEGFTDVKLAIRKERGYYNDVDVIISIEGYRPETNEEMQIRLVDEQCQTVARIQKLERELEALRKSK